MPCIANGFRDRQAMHTRPPLSSEIVGPVFQHGRKFQCAEPYGASRYNDNSARYAPTWRVASITMAINCASQPTEALEVEQPQLMRKRVRLQTARRREQCRVNQAKYRRKQLDDVKMLEETVQKLSADIPVLELQRNRLLYGGHQNAWHVVVDYFHVFRFGVPGTLPVASDDGANSTGRQIEYLKNAETKRQLAFLRSSMTENVILGERSGVDALMEQWQRYSSSFQRLNFRLERVERTNDTFLSVLAMLYVTVSENTLRCVFPHLLDGGQQGEHEGRIDKCQVGANSSKAFVRSKLLGRRLQIPCTLCFELDTVTCRVSRVETTVNFMTPLMDMLGDLSDVAFVLEHALITRDGAVGVRDRDA